jgi:hypothetical protein
MRRLRFAVFGRRSVLPTLGTMARGGMVFMELPGAVRAFEFMAFTRNTRQGDGHEKQGKKFHRGAS